MERKLLVACSRHNRMLAWNFALRLWHTPSGLYIQRYARIIFSKLYEGLTRDLQDITSRWRCTYKTPSCECGMYVSEVKKFTRGSDVLMRMRWRRKARKERAREAEVNMMWIFPSSRYECKGLHQNCRSGGLHLPTYTNPRPPERLSPGL
ncbi:hypothetical protein PoB_005972800 [Plakobranchus ocellatus]|uniref:Uncharacterized protein n=1 Tax=Plakobranchus ocellatus TaxID=259542 RepID=A0AAV4CNB9_9GAST|nr:hypothetical protein PoB_005972800 [Plakobranchus ocellatus]